MEKLRKTDLKDQITLLIKELEEKCPNNILWQTVNGKRILINVELIYFDEKVGDIKMLLQGDYQDLDIDQPVFLKSDYKSTVFKTQVVSLIENEIEIKVPEEICLLNQRSFPHISVIEQSLFAVFIFKGHKLPLKYRLQIIDISLGGLALLVSSKDMPLFVTGAIVDFSSIAHSFKIENMTGKICYIREYIDSSGADQMYITGINFAQNLPDIDSVIKVKKATEEEKELGLEELTSNLLLSQEKVQDIIHKMDLRDNQMAGKLRQNIEYLERLQYLTSTMRYELMLSISIETISYALKLSSQNVVGPFLKDVSVNLRADMRHFLSQKLMISQIMKNQDELIDFVLHKEGKGEFQLNKTSFNSIV